TLVIEATGGRYHRLPVGIEGPGNSNARAAQAAEQWPRTVSWFLRSPVAFVARIPARLLLGAGNRIVKAGVSSRVLAPGVEVVKSNSEGLDLRVEVLSRPRDPSDERLITVTLVNRSRGAKGNNSERCLFQSHFTATIEAQPAVAAILPYPEP